MEQKFKLDEEMSAFYEWIVNDQNRQPAGARQTAIQASQLRDFCTTNIELLETDERIVVDKYFDSLEKEKKKNYVKHFRNALSLYRMFRHRNVFSNLGSDD